jgi:hypothetical protein
MLSLAAQTRLDRQKADRRFPARQGFRASCQWTTLHAITPRRDRAACATPSSFAPVRRRLQTKDREFNKLQVA